jgi:hypothetical protein
MKLALVLLFLTSSAVAGLVAEQKVAGFKLQLEEEVYLSDPTGVLIPKQMMTVQIGRLVRIYRTDGTFYQGRVTEIEETDTTYKIYGTIHSVEGAKFGFVLAKGGVFAGAVVEIKSQVVYAVEFSEAYKGFVLVRTHKYDKPQS